MDANTPWRIRDFPPDDLDAARRTAQLAFERVLFDQGKEEVTTADVLRGIAETRRTLTAELVADFEQDNQGLRPRLTEPGARAPSGRVHGSFRSPAAVSR